MSRRAPPPPSPRPIAGLYMRMSSTSGTFEPPKASAPRFVAAASLPPAYTPPTAAMCDCTDPASGAAACLDSMGDTRAALLAKWALAHVGNGRVPPGPMTSEQAMTVALFTYAQAGDDDPDAQLAAAAEAAAQANFENDGNSGVGSVAERVNTWMAHRAEFGRDALEDDRWLGFVAHLCAALRLLPIVAGRVFRGVQTAQAEIKTAFAPGSRIIWPGFVSATTSIEAARSATRGIGTLFTIEAKCARQIGSLAAVDEQELLFEPNSEFVVKSVGDSGSAGVVVVELIQAETRTPLLGSGAISAAAKDRASRHKHHHRHKKSGGGGSDPVTGDPSSSPLIGNGPDTSPVRIRSRTRSGEDVVNSAPTTMTLSQLCTLSPSSMPASAASPVASAVTVTAMQQPRKSRSAMPIRSEGTSPASTPSTGSPAPSPRPSHSPVLGVGIGGSPSPMGTPRLMPTSPKRMAIAANTVTMWSAARSYAKIRSLRYRPNQRFMCPQHPAWAQVRVAPLALQQASVTAPSPTPTPRMPQVTPTVSTPSKHSSRRKVSPVDM